MGRKLFPAVAAVATLGLMGAALTSNAEAQILETAEDFGVLGATTVTNTGPSVITGNVGVSPGNAIVGFPPGIVVSGTLNAGNAVATQAQADALVAYNDLMGRPFDVDLTGQDLGGLLLGPAVYFFAASAQLTGTLTLDGQGDPDSEFIFQIGSALTTASNSAVLLINGADAANVYWAVGSSATLGTNTTFAGTIIALTSITLNTGATINCGRALALNGAVTLDTNTITLCVTGPSGGGGPGDDIPLNELFGEGVAGTQQTAFGASKLFGSTILGQAGLWLNGGGRGVTSGASRTSSSNGQATSGNAGAGQSVSGDNSAGQNGSGNNNSAGQSASRRNGGEQDYHGKTYRPLKLGALASGAEGIVAEDYRPRTWRSWATGFGAKASLDGETSTESAGLDTQTVGFAAGFDVEVDLTTLVGIAGGYTNSRFSVDQRLTSGTVDGMHVGLYAIKRLGPMYLAATGDYAHFDNETNRFLDWVVDERHEGDFTSEQFGASLESGWKQSIGVHNVTPFAGLRVSHLESDGFAEDSDGAVGILGLTVDSNSVTSLESSLGIQFDTRIVFSNGRVFTPFARIAWIHEFNPERGIGVSLTSSPAATFSAEGASAASDAAKVNAGVQLDITENTGLFAVFDGEFSSESQSYAGNGGLKLSW